MQTPAGYELRDGVVHAVDWWAIIFNPSMPYRLTHMLIASGLTVAFLIAGLSALRWLWGDRGAEVRTTLRFGVWMAALLIPVQIAVGDLHGHNTLEHQPQKVAAMEGNWDTGPAKPLLLFALPDAETRENRFEIGIPYGASLILKWDPQGVVPGLNDFVTAEGEVRHPPVAPVFFAFRVMVGIGFLMLAMSWASAWFMRGGRGPDGLPKPLLWGLSGMAFSGWFAVLAGWYTTEIGRQPWLVSGILTTKDAVAAVPAPMVLSTLVAYLLVYAALTVAYLAVLSYMARSAAGRGGMPSDLRLGGALTPAE
jgi:cytochrome d ubiquinol oxidase subunit I